MIEEEKEETELIRETRKIKVQRAKLRRERAEGGFAQTFMKGATVVGRGTFKATQGIAKFSQNVARQESRAKARVSKVSKKRRAKTKKILSKQRKKALGLT